MSYDSIPTWVEEDISPHRLSPTAPGSSQSANEDNVEYHPAGSNRDRLLANPGDLVDRTPSPHLEPKRQEYPSKPEVKVQKPVNHSNLSDRLRELWGNSWVVETFSCCIALIFLAATVITLAIHQNKPQPKWPRLISINALIAIFSALMKAALVLPLSEGNFAILCRWWPNAK